jgi:ergothioneine biosynthesis protein EgtB
MMAATSLRGDQTSANQADGTHAPGRVGIQAAFTETRSLSVSLAAPLSPEDQQVQSMDDVSPSKWHLGHVTWFFENFLLIPLSPGYQPFHPRFGYIFNSYYEAVGPRHARHRRGLLTRPALADVLAYRAHVDTAMMDLMEGLAESQWPSAAAMIDLGIHHEQQHQELLLTDIKHVLGVQPLSPAYRDDLPEPAHVDRGGDDRPSRRFIGVPGGEHEIGHGGDGFCFDNETPHHKVWLEDFALAAGPVTNGDFLSFIEDGGYETAAHWLADGWAWVQAGAGNLEGTMAPLYWRQQDGEWWEFTLGGRRRLDPGAPVCHLTYFEADAFARFAGKRLPTEAEWEIATATHGHKLEETANSLAAGNLHPIAGKLLGDGFSGLFGDVWEWTASAYAPYPGFRPSVGAVGEYNGKFMVSQLVLKGGSCVTPPGHVRASYRNFFYPHQNWQFTGLRLAEDG